MVVKNINYYSDKYSKLIEPKILEVLTVNTDKKNKELIEYQIFTGGKRLRPVLVFLACQLLGGQEKDAVWPAAGLEILHNYSLIVDDIIDDGRLRRGQPTLWHKFGKSMASCAAIDYAAAIFQSANRAKNPKEVSEIFAKTLKTIVDGEILDILFERSGRQDEPFITQNRYNRINEADFFEMIGQKTAILFKTCCQVGGMMAGANKKDLKSLENFGYNLGLAFQIQDDILDIFGDEKSFGKKIGKDIQERKGGNIIILLALENLPTEDRQKILKIMQGLKISDDQIKEVMTLIQKTDALAGAQKLKEKYVKLAQKNLVALPQNGYNKTLKEIIDFISIREK
jgi:geranylgeranyl diphosphate synthase, type I